MTEPEVIDVVTKGGALGVLVFLIPLLRRVDANLATIAATVPAVFDGLRDAGVKLEEPPTVRSSVAALVRRLVGVTTALAVALLLAGCSATADVREGLDDLGRDFDSYRRASVPRAGVDPDRHAALGMAIGEHVESMKARVR